MLHRIFLLIEFANFCSQESKTRLKDSLHLLNVQRYRPDFETRDMPNSHDGTDKLNGTGLLREVSTDVNFRVSSLLVFLFLRMWNRLRYIFSTYFIYTLMEANTSE